MSDGDIDKMSVLVGFRTDRRQSGLLGPHLLGPLLLLRQPLQGAGSDGLPPLLRRLTRSELIMFLVITFELTYQIDEMRYNHFGRETCEYLEFPLDILGSGGWCGRTLHAGSLTPPRPRLLQHELVAQTSRLL